MKGKVNNFFGADLNTTLQAFKPKLMQKTQNQVLNDYAQRAGSLEDGKISNFFFCRMQASDRASSVLATMNIVIDHYDKFDCSFDTGSQRSQRLTMILLWMNLAVLVLLVISEICRQITRLDLSKSQLQVDINTTVFNNQQTFLPMFFQLLLISMQPLPFLEPYSYTSYDLYDRVYFKSKINYVLCILSLAKGYIVFRALLNNTLYATPRSSRLSLMYGNEYGYAYTIKCTFKDAPISLMFSVFFFQSFYFGVAIRVAERSLDPIFPTGIQFDSYISSIWLVIITMTTVGYGDYYPRTPIGRLLISLISIWGIFTVSIFVVVLTEALKLNNTETAALQMAKQLLAKEDMKVQAGEIIKHLVKIYRYNKKQKAKRLQQLYMEFDNETSEISKAEVQSGVQLRSKIENFKASCREVRALYTKEDLQVEMENRFNKFEEILGALTINQRKIWNYIDANLFRMISPDRLSKPVQIDKKTKSKLDNRSKISNKSNNSYTSKKK